MNRGANGGAQSAQTKVQRKNFFNIMTFLVIFPELTYQEKPLKGKEIIICKDLKVGVCIEVGKHRL